MDVIAHSLPLLLPALAPLAVMNSFMTEQICHFARNEEERGGRPEPETTTGKVAGVSRPCIQGLVRSVCASLPLTCSSV